MKGESEELFPQIVPDTARNNPMVVANGILPSAVENNIRCKSCIHLFHHQYAKKYYKCDYRHISASASTDHRVNWFACAKYEEDKSSEEK